jgi:hypothetical protein
MSDPAKYSLRSNPFTAYRDPQTGRWTIVNVMSAKSSTSDRATANSAQRS